MLNSYYEIIQRYWPNSSFYTTGNLYADINWLSSPIPEVDILAKDVDLYKEKKINIIHKVGLSLIQQYTEQVIGTSDPIQIDVYKQKYYNAFQYKQEVSKGNIPSVPQILQNEVALTGEPLNIIVDKIISNNSDTWSILDPIIGQIEGMRRVYKKNILEAGTTPGLSLLEIKNEIDAVPTPVWPDIPQQTII